MRIFFRFGPSAALAFAMATSVGVAARADDCVNTANNNPAFSSNFIVGAQPCPPPIAPARKAALPDKVTPGSPDKPVKTRTANSDRPTVTTTPNGRTLLKNGDTTVCISGSVSATMVTGSGRLTGGMVHDRDTSLPACD